MNQSALAALHRRHAELLREQANVEEQIAAELAGGAASQAPARKIRPRAMPSGAVPSGTVSDLGMARAKKKLRALGIPLEDEGGQ